MLKSLIKNRALLICLSVLTILLLLGAFNQISTAVFAQDGSVDEIEEELKETEEQKKLKEEILNKTDKEIDGILNSSLSIQQKIWALNKQITELEDKISTTEAEIEQKEDELAKQQGDIAKKEREIRTIVNDLYKSSRIELYSLILNSDNSNNLMRGFVLKKYSLNRNVSSIKVLNEELLAIAAVRNELDSQKVELDAENIALDRSRDALAVEQANLEAEIAAKNAARSKLQSEISSLNGKISELQEALILARSGTEVPSVGSVPSGSDFNASLEGFQQNAPTGSFGVFSFGAYTHRQGMSQYGAKGRAEGGQDYKQILKAYYGKSPVSRDTSGKISVAGHGDLDFEKYYLYGIAEMPGYFPTDALRAQAVAARTYAKRYKDDGLTICTTQQCQVFLKSKAESPPAEWKAAVDSTEGMVLEDVVTFYSSTSGAVVKGIGWDTTDGTGGVTDLGSKAYESIGGSPWFYKSWYRASYSDSSSSCGRNPWMSESEMVDIVNAWLVITRRGIKEGKSVDDNRIIPTTINSCNYGVGGNPYSSSELASLLEDPVTGISGVPVVSNSSSGDTTNVAFVTNRGSINIPGGEFKTTYNTRAPGYIHIPQFGFTFINIERK